MTRPDAWREWWGSWQGRLSANEREWKRISSNSFKRFGEEVQIVAAKGEAEHAPSPLQQAQNEILRGIGAQAGLQRSDRNTRREAEHAPSPL